jgi:hypothetical protein
MDTVATMIKFCAAIALACMPVTFAQTLPPAEPENTVISTRSSLVLVPALVRTGSGQLVYTLTANDFTITDDGVEQRVALDEDTDNQPLALAIVVETGRGAGRRLNNYSELGPVLDAMVGSVPHRVAVVGFDSTPRLVQNFTPDVDVAARTMSGLRPGDGGNAILLSFQPQSPHPGLHAIGLRLKDYPNLVVTSRSSYWADTGGTAVPQP